MRRLLGASGIFLACTVLCASCGSEVVGPTDLPPNPPPPGPIVPPPPPVPGLPEIFVGAGDIGACDNNSEATARLLDVTGGTVFTTGDNAYYHGSREDFRNCYEPTWGRHKARTRPSPGNHDYEAPGAAPYFEYFGANAGPAGLGYYAFDVAAWHALALNSNVPAGAGSAQGAWLRSQFVTHAPSRCAVAYWHHPLFSSGPNGGHSQMREIWRILYDAGVDVVLSGHDHLYERFAPQDPDGRADQARGIRQFTVGTGGAPLYQAGTPVANSEMRVSAFGILKLTLASDRYEWEFLSTSGTRDAGTAACH